MSEEPDKLMPEKGIRMVRKLFDDIHDLLELGPEYEIQIRGSRYDHFTLTIFERIA